MNFRTAFALCITPLAAAAQNPAQAPGSLLQQAAPQFSQTGPFPEILRKLAITLRGMPPLPPYILFGFIKAEGPDPQLTSNASGSTVEDQLKLLCSKDQRYTFTEEHGMLVVLPKDARSPGIRLLRLRLSRFDMVVDDWPENLFMRVPEFSPDVSAFLTRMYALESPPKRPGAIPPGTPGVSMSTNLTPPHTEIHLRNVSVMEVLAAISARTAELAQMRDQDGRTLFWPVGWQCRFPPVGDASYGAWSSQIFSHFP